MLLLIFPLQVNTNGIISFDGQHNQYILKPFDDGYDRPVVAPLACDINTLRNHGRVYYRSTTDNATLQHVSSDVSNGTDFEATFVIIATWLNVTYSTPSSSISFPILLSGFVQCTSVGINKCICQVSLKLMDCLIEGHEPRLQKITRVLVDLRLKMRLHWFVLFKIGSLQSTQHAM